jgi:hypothetical protein
MNSIVDKDGEIVAYLYQNVIIDTKREKVLGVILGNCFFGKSKEPLGKFFQNKFYKKSGKIVAKLGEKYSKDEFPENDFHIINEAWKSLLDIKDHICVWIEPKKDWGKKEFC